MELVQLKYFVKLAELLSFTEAAKASFVTQSTLSISIKQLEEELGVRLFDRIGKKVFLTDYGQLFLDYARTALATLNDGVQELNAARHVFKAKLQVGVTYSMGELLKSHLAAFTRQYPGIQLTISMFNTVEEIIQHLTANRLDIALTYRPDKLAPSIETMPLSDYPLSAIVADHHPLASCPQVTFRDLIRYPLVTSAKGMHTRNMVDLLLARNGVKMEPHIEVNDTNFIIDLVETGHWISILAPVSLHTHPHVKAIPIKGKQEYLSACLLWLKGKSRQAIYQALIRELLL